MMLDRFGIENMDTMVEIVREFDTKNDGTISFEEFKNVPEIAKRRILPALIIACIWLCPWNAW